MNKIKINIIVLSMTVILLIIFLIIKMADNNQHINAVESKDVRPSVEGSVEAPGAGIKLNSK